MTKREVELRALEAIDRARRGGQCEHSFVEFKAKWPLAREAARQLAGMCNAARGEPVLLLIGVDERGKVWGAANAEGAVWKSEFDSCFEGPAPAAVHSLILPCDGEDVVAILFETDRSPYVVRRHKVDSKTDDRNLLEVPWRELQATRSARREELLRMMQSHHAAPSIEVLDAEMVISHVGRPIANGVDWLLCISLYVVPRSLDRVVIPFHQCALSVSVGEPDVEPPEWLFTMTGDSLGLVAGPSVEYSETIRGTRTELLIDGPGCCQFKGHARSLTYPEGPVAMGWADLTLRFAHSVHVERLRVGLSPAPERREQVARWIATDAHPRAHLMG